MVVAVMVASLVTVDKTVEGRGILKPARMWPVHSLETGLITDIYVTAGDTVRAGDALVQLDSLLLKNRLANLRTEHTVLGLGLERERAAHPIERRLQGTARQKAASLLMEARANLRGQLANYKFGRNPDSVLAAHVPGTHVGIDRALAAVRSAEAALKEAEARQDMIALAALEWRKQQAELRGLQVQIDAAQERMSRLTIRAPAGGVVLTDHLERLKGSRVQEGAVVLEIGGSERWQVDVFIAGRDVHQVSAGDEAKVKIQALQEFRNDQVRGRVVSIASEPIESNRSNAGMYRVAVDLNEDDITRIGADKLRMGFSAQVNIITGSGSIIELLRRYLEEQFGI